MFNVFCLYIINGDLMRLFDVHNDCMTQVKYINDYLGNSIDDFIKVIVMVFFLSEKKLPIKEIKSMINNIENRGTPFIAIEDISQIKYEELDELSELKPLYCSLTWNDENKLAGGCYSKGKLTDLGKKYINKIETFSYVDTAHLNKKSFYQLAKITKRPLLNSHTNLKMCKKHKRNINNRQIKKIIKSHGLVCLTGVKEFLKNEGTLKDYIDSIYEFYKKYGSDNLGLATDFIGSSTFPLAYANYHDFKKIYVELLKKGLTEVELDKIFYLNAWRFFNK